jgi:hypothetical protein
MNVSLVPSYLLISKRLERISDNIKDLSDFIRDKKVDIVNMPHKKFVLTAFRAELQRASKHVAKSFPGGFDLIEKKDEKKIEREISKISSVRAMDYFDDMLRYIIDIEEEIIKIAFYNQLIRDKIIL